jgi:plasmid stabilization system protein ParE
LTAPFVYSTEALQEYKDIIRYTKRQWGNEQAVRYAEQIEAAALGLATGRCFYKELNEVMLGLRVAPAGSHYVFCLPRQDQPAVVLAILHSRMDLMTRLKARI